MASVPAGRSRELTLPSLLPVEVVDNNLNPEWCNGFVINHLAGEIQNLRFTCVLGVAAVARHCLCVDAANAPRRVLDYDATNKDGTLKGDSLGSCETTVDEITKSSHRGLSLTLSGKGSKAGSLLHVMWESVDPSVRGDATLTLSGIDLANRAGMLSSSSPFWRLLKRRPDGVYVLVGKSGACVRGCLRLCAQSSARAMLASKLCSKASH